MIGANASGKSNFVSLFKFIHDIVESGLENAVSIQGGAQYLRNMNCTPDDRLTIELSAEGAIPGGPLRSESRVARQIYRFSLAFNDRGVSVVKDELKDSSFKIARTGDEYTVDGDADTLTQALPEIMRARRQDQSKPDLLIEILRFYAPFDGLKSIATYDIDPKGPKAGVLFGGKSDLEPDANNLAVVLNRILSDDEERRKMLNLLKVILPFAHDLRADQLRDGSFLFDVQERFSKESMPAAFMSDGTIDAIALIAILYFERKSLVVIEEPDRNLHPSLMSTLVELLKDASAIKQIIATTHNPEVVRYADPAQLILISRDEAGLSHVSRPVDNQSVQRFLRDEIGIQELYVDNLLDA